MKPAPFQRAYLVRGGLPLGDWERGRGGSFSKRLPTLFSSPFSSPRPFFFSQVKDISSGQAAYNVVADTVTGVNVRKSDNLFQAIFILVTILLLAAFGMFSLRSTVGRTYRGLEVH